MKKIILDTDFLLHNLNKGINFLVEIDRICDFKYEICVLDKTLDEIRGKKGEKLALQFINKKFKMEGREIKKWKENFAKIDENIQKLSKILLN